MNVAGQDRSTLRPTFRAIRLMLEMFGMLPYRESPELQCGGSQSQDYAGC
jgi:hypothetical protein